MIEIICISTYFVVFLAWGFIRSQYQKQYALSHQTKSLEKQPKREALLVKLVGFSVGISTLLWAFTPFIAFAYVAIPDLVRLLGVPISIFSTWYFYEVHRQLGKNWSPVLEIRPQHELVVSGLYKYVRHPMYTAIIVWWLGNVFLTANYVLLGVQFFTIFIMLVIRVPDEEKMMQEQFGQQYLEYSHRTKRFIPFIF
ncbi:MAG: protein-S-isoprenylcysteine O-methyltransferase [Microscillaceae bacterium]|jgi:protein-S-isoprenylcysteine O-methyltransferase Ste14|nr:protein-S-isoprenylcysteine O-methyltransferase [Microscillaceae bacterium]